MAINLASKYSQKVAERFTLKSLTDNIGLNKDYDWEGAQTVTVYSIPTLALGDYTKSGTSRYGTPNELQDTVQTLTLTKDRSVAITIDKGNNASQMGVKKVGEVVARQLDEVFKPELDTYRLATVGATTNTTGTATALDKTNIYLKFLAMTEFLDENKVPLEGRVCYVTPSTYNLFKQDANFVVASEKAMDIKIKGLVGDVDGVKIIKVPTSYMPTKTPMLMFHPSILCSPLKLEELKVHDNPPGINGQLIEMRWIYDAFVLASKSTGAIKHLIP